MKVGDRISFKASDGTKREGQVIRFMPQGMVDIRFDDASHRIERRPKRDLRVVRAKRNPRVRRNPTARARKAAELREAQSKDRATSKRQAKMADDLANVEKDLFRAEGKATTFTRPDPVRVATDNRTLCGNPIDGTAYYLAIADDKRPVLRWITKKEVDEAWLASFRTKESQPQKNRILLESYNASILAAKEALFDQIRKENEKKREEAKKKGEKPEPFKTDAVIRDEVNRSPARVEDIAATLIVSVRGELYAGELTRFFREFYLPTLESRGDSVFSQKAQEKRIRQRKGKKAQRALRPEQIKERTKKEDLSRNTQDPKSDFSTAASGDQREYYRVRTRRPVSANLRKLSKFQPFGYKKYRIPRAAKNASLARAMSSGIRGLSESVAECLCRSGMVRVGPEVVFDPEEVVEGGKTISVYYKAKGDSPFFSWVRSSATFVDKTREGAKYAKCLTPQEEEIEKKLRGVKNALHRYRRALNSIWYFFNDLQTEFSRVRFGGSQKRIEQLAGAQAVLTEALRSIEEDAEDGDYAAVQAWRKLSTIPGFDDLQESLEKYRVEGGRRVGLVIDRLEDETDEEIIEPGIVSSTEFARFLDQVKKDLPEKGPIGTAIRWLNATTELVHPLQGVLNTVFEEDLSDEDKGHMRRLRDQVTETGLRLLRDPGSLGGSRGGSIERAMAIAEEAEVAGAFARDKEKKFVPVLRARRYGKNINLFGQGGVQTPRGTMSPLARQSRPFQASLSEEAKATNKAVGNIIRDIQPYLIWSRQEKAEEANKEVETLLLLLAVFNNIDGQDLVGVLYERNPKGLLQGMISDVEQKITNLKGGEAALSTKGRFSVFMTYNPVLFELTRLTWGKPRGSSLNDVEMLGRIDAAGRFGYAANAVLQASLVANSEEEVYARLSRQFVSSELRNQFLYHPDFMLRYEADIDEEVLSVEPIEYNPFLRMWPVCVPFFPREKRTPGFPQTQGAFNNIAKFTGDPLSVLSRMKNDMQQGIAGLLNFSRGEELSRKDEGYSVVPPTLQDYASPTSLTKYAEEALQEYRDRIAVLDEAIQELSKKKKAAPKVPTFYTLSEEEQKRLLAEAAAAEEEEKAKRKSKEKDEEEDKTAEEGRSLMRKRRDRDAEPLTPFGKLLKKIREEEAEKQRKQKRKRETDV